MTHARQRSPIRCGLAAQAVAAVLGGSNLNDALGACWARHPALAPAGRGAVQDLAYGALRAFGRGDFFLARLMERPLKSAPVRALLLVALARLEARPEQAHVAVDQAVEAAAELAGGKFKGLVNGVLRSFLRGRDALLAAAGADEVARQRHPLWWLARLRAEHPVEWANHRRDRQRASADGAAGQPAPLHGG
ncbi:MAG: hypothetical protein MZW92_03650 [Comamonadaceae bacterium]|nr:hypothetical protein [Comamonadaceae bacterium]